MDGSRTTMEGRAFGAEKPVKGEAETNLNFKLWA